MASGRHHAEDVVRDERANRQNGPILDEGAIRGKKYGFHQGKIAGRIS